MPPVQSKVICAPCGKMERLIGKATFKYIVAWLESPARSVALTRKVFVPASVEAGVPESLPFTPTVSQAGPVTLAKASLSPGSGSVALLAIEAKYGRPAWAPGPVKGLVLNEGEVSAWTVIPIEPMPAKPPESTTSRRKELMPRSASEAVPEREPSSATASQAGPLTL